MANPADYAKAFEAARDTVKQVMTLSTAILTLSLAAANLAKTLPNPGRCWLIGSWFLHLASLLAGTWALFALTGGQQPTPGGADPSIYASAIRIPAAAQLILFVIAVGVTVVAGVRLLRATGESPVVAAAEVPDTAAPAQQSVSGRGESP
jgi:hypothetical protein